MGTPVMTAIRAALRSRLVTDGELVALLGGPRVYHRYLRKAAELASPDGATVTYFDYTAHPTPVIPRIETRIQVDVWARIIDAAEVIAHRVTQLLDLFESADASLTPFRVETGEANVVALRLELEHDGISPESPTIVQKTLQFSMIAFPLAA